MNILGLCKSIFYKHPKRYRAPHACEIGKNEKEARNISSTKPKKERKEEDDM